MAEQGLTEGDKSTSTQPPQAADAAGGFTALPHWPVSAPAALSRRKPVSRGTWIGVGVGLAVTLVALVVWFKAARDIEPEAEVYPHLPEWFQPAHRVARAPRGPVSATGKMYVEGKGFVDPRDVPPPGDFTEEWFEKKFTHYMAGNSFYWSRAKLDNPAADGKILAGAKVILGERLGELALVCKRTADNRLINMYVRSTVLRERSLGPPAADDDD